MLDLLVAGHSRGVPLITCSLCLYRCAMALVHSRVGRVFYGCAEPLTGGLGSQYKIHTQQGINHHFEVFRGVLEHCCRSLYQSKSVDHGSSGAIRIT